MAGNNLTNLFFRPIYKFKKKTMSAIRNSSHFNIKIIQIELPSGFSGSWIAFV